MPRLADLIRRIFLRHAPTPRAGTPRTISLNHKLTPFARTAWLPRTEAGPGRADASRFCGPALLKQGETWPACSECGLALQLFLQLNHRDFPPITPSVENGNALPFGEGILQLFYCGSYDCNGGWEPFGGAHIQRVLKPDENTVLAERTGAGTFPARSIIGWDPVTDYPEATELELLGTPLSTSDESAYEQLNAPARSDKLLGWPYWVQGVEYPNCPREGCGKTMRYIFQIESEKNIPYMFGDSGVGHITICPDHPDVLAFGWACC